MNRVEELALVARCVAFDDRRAFARLVEATQPSLLRFLCGMTGGDTMLAADLAQETYIKAWRGMGQWRQVGRFSTWLYAIAVNEHRTWARGRHITEDLSEAAQACASTNAIDNSVDLNAALLTLSREQRASVLLYYYRDLSVKQISKLLFIPENTVKSHLKRARAALKKYIEE